MHRGVVIPNYMSFLWIHLMMFISFLENDFKFRGVVSLSVFIAPISVCVCLRLLLFEVRLNNLLPHKLNSKERLSYKIIVRAYFLSEHVGPYQEIRLAFILGGFCILDVFFYVLYLNSFFVFKLWSSKVN